MDFSATNRALTKRPGQDHFLKIKIHFELSAGLGRMAAPGIIKTGSPMPALKAVLSMNEGDDFCSPPSTNIFSSQKAVLSMNEGDDFCSQPSIHILSSVKGVLSMNEGVTSD